MSCVLNLNLNLNDYYQRRAELIVAFLGTWHSNVMKKEKNLEGTFAGKVRHSASRPASLSLLPFASRSTFT
jgi:hypothetical protein